MLGTSKRGEAESALLPQLLAERGKRPLTGRLCNVTCRLSLLQFVLSGHVAPLDFCGRVARRKTGRISFSSRHRVRVSGPGPAHPLFGSSFSLGQALSMAGLAGD